MTLDVTSSAWVRNLPWMKPSDCTFATYRLGFTPMHRPMPHFLFFVLSTWLNRFLAWRSHTITRCLRPFLWHLSSAAASRCVRVSDLTFGFDTPPAPAGAFSSLFFLAAASSSCFLLAAASVSVAGGDGETTVKVRAFVVKVVGDSPAHSAIVASEKDASQ